MIIEEAVIKGIIRVGNVIRSPRNQSLLRVKCIDNKGIICTYLDQVKQEDMIKRGFTVVRLMNYEEYVPIA